MDARVAHLWNFGVGSATATINLGSRRPFLAWGSITFIDTLGVYDGDNAGCIEVYQIDGVIQDHVASGGRHLGSRGSTSNLRPGAVRGMGRSVTFRLRTMHFQDLEHYGVGTVITLD